MSFSHSRCCLLSPFVIKIKQPISKRTPISLRHLCWHKIYAKIRSLWKLTLSTEATCMSIQLLIRLLTKKIQWRIYIKYEMLINSIVLCGKYLSNYWLAPQIIWIPCHWRIGAGVGGGARDPSLPLGPILFIFAQYWANILPKNRLAQPPLGLAHPHFGNPGFATAWVAYPPTESITESNMNRSTSSKQCHFRVHVCRIWTV